MMKQEFEAIAKRTVTNELYQAINTLYMNSTLNKYEFVKSIKTMLKTIPEEKKSVKKVLIGVKEMPNGTFMTYEAEVVGCDIRSGKLIVKRTSPNRCWAETDFDFYHTSIKEL